MSPRRGAHLSRICLAGAALLCASTPLSGVHGDAATNPLAVAVSGAPSQVAEQQSVTYSITVTETAGAQATGVTVTDQFNALVGPGGSGPFTVTTSLGSCSQTGTQVSCNTPTLAANGNWVVTVQGQVNAGIGTTIANTATVAGQDGTQQVSSSASTSTLVALRAGFAQTTLLSTLQNPTCFAFAPNGDIFIAEQRGPIVVDHQGALLPTPLLTVATDGSTELGVLGMALDPQFSTNGYLYVSYTTTNDYARLSRFTVVNGAASPSSEVVYYTGTQLQSSGHHSANDLHVGPDGALWWSVGDAVPNTSNAQTLGNINGKILRFNLDGTVPGDNPFVRVPGAVPYIYAYGLRNPFRFTFLPTHQAITEDTGSSFWEELDTIQPGGNYGWDLYEGNCYSCGYINPVYAYGHRPTDSAASAIAAYTGAAFPQAYNGIVFFGDYNRHDIEAVRFDPSYSAETSQSLFDAAAGTIADLQQGPDGNLYFVSIFEGTFSEVRAVGPFAPTASARATPAAGLAPLSVQFSSTGSADAYNAPLSYAWDFGDGSPVDTTASPAHVYQSNGTYTATLTVSNGTLSASATTAVTVGATPPSISITQPAAGTTFAGGQTITFSGTASDAVDGAEPPAAYTWQVDLYSHGVMVPSYTAEAPHPFLGPLGGVTQGSFTVPSDVSIGTQSFFRITLSVTDSLGLTSTQTEDVQPTLTSWTATSTVSGAAIAVDGTWQTSPYTAQDVVGVQHVLSGVPVQVVNGSRYRMYGWSDGQALTERFASGASPATYTAQYEPAASTLSGAWHSTDVGTPAVSGNADYAAASGSFYVDGAGADVYGSQDQFHYVWQPLTGDGTIVARLRYQTNTDPWAKAGMMFKQSATAGAPYANVFVTPDVSSSRPNINGLNCVLNVNAPNAGCDAPLPPVTPPVGYGVHLQYTNQNDRGVTQPIAGFTSPNKWLKLQRVANTFIASYSTDGTHWTQIAAATVPMTSAATVGLFVTSHNAGQTSSVAFDSVQVAAQQRVLASPWNDANVGSPSVAGAAGSNNGTFTVYGAGVDIWHSTDQFNYVYRNAQGNVTLIARVTSQSNTDPNAKAGIMLKQSTSAGSKYVLVALGPGYVKVQWNFTNSTAIAPLTTPNVWFKLVRSGATVAVSTSPDGATWTQRLSVPPGFSGGVTGGLFVCSHNANLLGMATFDNVGFNAF